MSYERDMRHAAERHFNDGRLLQQNKRYDNAGYHFGLAAEMAVKDVLRRHNVPENATASHQGKELPVFYLHFPEFRMVALQLAEGRCVQDVLTLLRRSSFLQQWDIAMRYAPNASVSKERAEMWQQDANQSLGLMIG